MDVRDNHWIRLAQGVIESNLPLPVIPFSPTFGWLDVDVHHKQQQKK